VPSRSRNVDIVCPECEARNPFTEWEIVDSALNPELFAAIVDGSLFDFTCRHCQEVITLDFSIRLHGPDTRAMIQYDAPRGPQLETSAAPTPEYRLRKVRDQNGFIELARIGKDSLNDGVMLLLKHMLARDLEQQFGNRPLVCGYDSIVEEAGERFLGFAFVMPDDTEPRLFPATYKNYEGFVRAMEPDLQDIMPPGTWVNWDHQTAQRLLDALEAGAAME